MTGPDIMTGPARQPGAELSPAIASDGMPGRAGFYGKLPAHGDFVRRFLPSSFVRPWDDWLRAGLTAARAHLGADWDTAWNAAPVWRFALPAGACGPDQAAGVLAPSRDTVGRCFPLTIAVRATPDPAWFDAVGGLALRAIAGDLDADALACALAENGAPSALPREGAPAGWRTADLVWDLPALPPATAFHFLVRSDAA